jgi:hypothetical protein
MRGPQIKFLDGVPYISVGDVLALARQTHKLGANAAQFAGALETLIPKPIKNPPKKENPRVRNKR